MNNGTTQNADVIEAPELTQAGLTQTGLTQTGQSGRASWDERGNTVWEWQTEPGIYSREVSVQQLQSLQASELRLVDQHPGVTSTYSHWKRRYQDRYTTAPKDESELVMPAKRKDATKANVFEQFLKHIGLPA